MNNKKLEEILQNRFQGDIGAMADFLGLSIDELKKMLDGTISIPSWVWERLGSDPVTKPKVQPPPRKRKPAR